VPITYDCLTPIDHPHRRNLDQEARQKHPWLQTRKQFSQGIAPPLTACWTQDNRVLGDHDAQILTNTGSQLPQHFCGERNRGWQFSVSFATAATIITGPSSILLTWCTPVRTVRISSAADGDVTANRTSLGKFFGNEQVSLWTGMFPLPAPFDSAV
jgi:hypothetical protein